LLVSNFDREDLENKIRDYIKPTKKTKLFWRSRKLDTDETFKNINLMGSRRVIILGDEGESQQLSRLKATIAMHNFLDHVTTSQNISILVEADDNAEADCIIAASKGRATPVILSHLPGRLIGQAVFQPNLTTVYEELLSFRGNEFYIEKSAKAYGISGLTFLTASTHFSSCIIIGFITTDLTVHINPRYDQVLKDTDRPIFIAIDDSLIFANKEEIPDQKRTSNLLQNDWAVNLLQYQKNENPFEIETKSQMLKVCLVGCSKTTVQIIQQLVESKKCEISLIIEPGKIIESELELIANQQKIPIESGLSYDTQILEKYGIFKCDVIIISNEDKNSPINNDLNIIKSIFAIQSVVETGQDIHLIAELSDTDSRDMVSGLYELDFVVSDAIGSKILAQYIENPQLIGVIDEVIYSSRGRICIKNINRQRFPEILDFGTLHSRTLVTGRVLIGYRYQISGDLRSRTISKINPGFTTSIPNNCSFLQGIFIE
jgi:ion channel POLLUX/CASTOR